MPTSSSNQPEPDPDVKFIPASGDPADLRRQHQVDSEGEELEEGSKKCHRPSVNEGLFSWKGTASVLQAQLEPEVQQCLNLLNDWSADPTFVVRKILLSPGCLDFPRDQWLKIVKGYAVDLSKVLGAHYSSDVEAKQSQDLGELFQLSIRVPKQSKVITIHGDWVIAFGKTIQVIPYALPGRNSEYVAYQAYMSGLFTSITPSFHS